MATASTTYTFTAGTPASAVQVNQNFDDLVLFGNNSVVHRDGSKAMTAHLTLYAQDPTAANHATRKSYVDAKVAAVAASTSVGRVTGGTIANTTTTVVAGGTRTLFTVSMASVNGVWYMVNMNNGFVATLSGFLPTTHELLAGSTSIANTQQWSAGSQENSANLTGFFQGTGATITVTGTFVNRHTASIAYQPGWRAPASNWSIFRMGS